LNRKIELRRIPEGIVEAELGDLVKPVVGRAGYTAVTFSPSGKLLIAASIGTESLEVYDMASGSQLGRCRSYGFHTSLAVHPEGKILAGAAIDQAASTLEFIRLEPRLERYRLEMYVGIDVAGLNFSPDGEVLAITGASASGSSFQLHDVPSMRRRFRTDMAIPAMHARVYFAPDLPLIERAVFSPDGTRLVCPSPTGELVELDARTGSELRRWQAHEGPCTSVDPAMSREVILSGGMDGLIKVWKSDYDYQEPAKVEDPVTKAFSARFPSSELSEDPSGFEIIYA
jgi:WD40 repeat protein